MCQPIVAIYIDINVTRSPTETPIEGAGAVDTRSVKETRDKNASRSRVVVRVRRVTGPHPAAVNDGWVVVRHVNDVWCGRFDEYGLVAGLGAHDLLLIAFQVAGIACPAPQNLDGVHDLVFLIEESFAHGLGMVQILIQ